MCAFGVSTIAEFIRVTPFCPAEIPVLFCLKRLQLRQSIYLVFWACLNADILTAAPDKTSIRPWCSFFVYSFHWFVLVFFPSCLSASKLPLAWFVRYIRRENAHLHDADLHMHARARTHTLRKKKIHKTYYWVALCNWGLSCQSRKHSVSHVSVRM